MAFIWVYPADPGDYVQSEEIQEIRNNTNTLATNIFLPTPASSESIPFVQPLSDGIEIKDLVGDELQENLDVLKSENYCRGHHNVQYISDNSSDRITDNSSEHTDLQSSGWITFFSSYRITEHNNHKITDNGSHFTTVEVDNFTTRKGIRRF